MRFLTSHFFVCWIRNLISLQGYGGGTGRLDDFYSFSFDTNCWEEVKVLSEEKPGCRENNGVVIGDSSRVYLFGGYNGTRKISIYVILLFDILWHRFLVVYKNFTLPVGTMTFAP